ncbi:LysR family transcriptional regulator [Halomonadaceae bacterium KBTZ08]
MDWDHLRYIHALACGGTLSKGAERLGVHATTVLRRLDQMERELGVRLFERTRDGLFTTTAGEQAYHLANRLLPDIDHLERQLIGQDSRPEGTVRLATTDTLLLGLLNPMVAAITHRHPGIQIEIITGNDVISLSRREADIAIRPTDDPQETLVGRRIATIECAVYGATDYLEANGRTKELGKHNWVVPDDSLSHMAYSRWFHRSLKTTTPSLRCNSLQSLSGLVEAGAGLGVLPCYLGDAQNRLERIHGPLEGYGTGLWLLTHQDLKRMARIRVVLDELAEQLTEKRPMIEGRERMEHCVS